MQEAKEKHLKGQETKKNMKKAARLPRTAGLKTLSEMTEFLTKAGYNPSRIQERAERDVHEGAGCEEEEGEGGRGDGSRYRRC